MPRSRATRKKTLGMFATAALVESTMGKNAAMKIRKIAGGSPMPSQRIANGIQASGDRLLKKLTSGRNAARAARRVSEQQARRHAERDRQQKARRHAEERRDRIGHEASAAQLRPPRRGRRPRDAERATRGKSPADDTTAQTATSRAASRARAGGVDVSVKRGWAMGPRAIRARRPLVWHQRSSALAAARKNGRQSNILEMCVRQPAKLAVEPALTSVSEDWLLDRAV